MAVFCRSVVAASFESIWKVLLLRNRIRNIVRVDVTFSMPHLACSPIVSVPEMNWNHPGIALFDIRHRLINRCNYTVRFGCGR